MNLQLMSESQLAEHDHLFEKMGHLPGVSDLRALDPDSRQALFRYALFSDENVRLSAGLSSMSACDAFYNSYYWFLIFSKSECLMVKRSS